MFYCKNNPSLNLIEYKILIYYSNMIQLATITMLWELYNYYSMLSFIYHSYYYTSLAAYYGNKLYRILSGNNYYQPKEINIQMISFNEDKEEGWELVDVL